MRQAAVEHKETRSDSVKIAVTFKRRDEVETRDNQESGHLSVERELVRMMIPDAPHGWLSQGPVNC